MPRSSQRLIRFVKRFALAVCSPFSSTKLLIHVRSIHNVLSLTLCRTPPPPKEPTPTPTPPPPPTPLPSFISQFKGTLWFEKFFPDANSEVSIQQNNNKIDHWKELLICNWWCPSKCSLHVTSASALFVIRVNLNFSVLSILVSFSFVITWNWCFSSSTKYYVQISSGDPTGSDSVTTQARLMIDFLKSPSSSSCLLSTRRTRDLSRLRR